MLSNTSQKNIVLIFNVTQKAQKSQKYYLHANTGLGSLSVISVISVWLLKKSVRVSRQILSVRPSEIVTLYLESDPNTPPSLSSDRDYSNDSFRLSEHVIEIIP